MRARSGLGEHEMGCLVNNPFTKLAKYILCSPRSSRVPDYTIRGAQSWDSNLGLSDPRAGLPLNDAR